MGDNIRWYDVKIVSILCLFEVPEIVIIIAWLCDFL